MRRTSFESISLGTVLVLLSLGGGCSKRNETSHHRAEATSVLDAGPRAAEEPPDTALAAIGQGIFKTKNCEACHASSAGRSGPDLAGASMRRTSEWLEQMVRHPEVMVREDSIGHQLIEEYTIQMPNLGLTHEEAQALIEYLKVQDRVGPRNESGRAAGMTGPGAGAADRRADTP